MKFVVGCDDIETLGAEIELVVFVSAVVVAAAVVSTRLGLGTVLVVDWTAGAVLGVALVVVAGVTGTVLGVELVVVAGVTVAVLGVVVGVTGLTELVAGASRLAWLSSPKLVDGVERGGGWLEVDVVTGSWTPSSCPPLHSTLRLSQTLQQSQLVLGFSQPSLLQHLHAP